MKKKYDEMIDVIIPCHNVPRALLARCLASIACQDIVREVEVTIVNDASDDKDCLAGLDDAVKDFCRILKINIVNMDENAGPGVARQTGLDFTKHGYVTFIDADDTFAGAFALKAMRNVLKSNGGKNAMVSTIFHEIHEMGIPENLRPGPVVIPHERDMVWVFGKMYKRSFLDENGIRFHPTSRANEDNGFNHCALLVSDDMHQVAFSPQLTYYWHETEGSITRHADCEYAYGSTVRDSFYGYCENMAYAIQFALKKNPFNGEAQKFAARCMLIIYQYYIECVARANEHAAQNFEHARMYYNAVFKDIEDKIPENIMSEIYSDVMRNAYMGGSLMGFIPSMTIKEFLQKLRG